MPDKRSLAASIFILLLAFAVRVNALGEKAVWWDEAWSVWTAQQDFAQTTEITARDVHPPLYQWMLHGWVRLAGTSEFAVRYLSVLWGLITVAAVYPLTGRMGGKRAAFLAMFFIAVSAFHIHWSQETRMYAMAACTATLACYAYLRVNERWSRWWLLLIAASAGAALTHYLGALVLVILNLHWLITFRSRPRSFHARWIAAMMIAGLILMAWIAFAIGRTRSGGAQENTAPAFIFQLAATLLAVGTSVNVDQYIVPSLIVLGGFFVGLALYIGRNIRQHWHNGLLILLAGLFPPLLIFLLGFPNRFYHPRPEERYLVILVPVLYAGIGIALDQFWRVRKIGRVIGAAAVLGLLALYGAAYLQSVDGRYYRDDYAMMLRTVNLLAKPGEPILFVSGDRYPLVYYHLDRAAGNNPARHAVGFPFISPDSSSADIDSTISPFIGTNTRFWLIEIERGLGDPQNRVIPWLDVHYHRVLHIPIDYNGITLYAADSTLPDSTQILPPVIREARPGDVARIGVPGGVQADLLYGDTVIATQPAAPSWQLAQFLIYGAYPPGTYTLRAGDSRYTFEITHSQAVPINPPKNLDKTVGPFRLLGYTANTTRLRPGESLEITFFWQVIAAPPENYTVFAHLLGPFNPETNGPLWSGQDSYPASTPTRALWVGQVIADHRELNLPANTPPGPYTVEVGMYRLETGQRLQFADAADLDVIGGIVVGK